MGLFTTQESEDSGPDVFHFPTSKNLLMVFTKNPVLGQCKTRIADKLGDKTALAIYHVLIDHTAKVTEMVHADKWVYYSDFIPNEEDEWDSQFFTKMLQKGNDLGIRMRNAFIEGFSQGYEKIVIVGSDILELETEDITQALEALNANDVVIGPAKDGGYYLLGMKKLHERIFTEKLWGTNTVLSDTLKDLENLKWVLLSEKNDIDTIEDVENSPSLNSYLKQHN